MIRLRVFFTLWSFSLIKTYFKFLLIDLCHFRCGCLACSCSFCRAAVRKWRWKATSEIWMRKEYSNGISFESIREVNLWSYCHFSVDFWENNIIPSSLLLLLFNTHKNIGLKNSAVSLFSALDVCYRRRERRRRVSSWQSAPLLFTLADNKFNSHLLTTSQHKESMVCNVDGRDHSIKALFHLPPDHIQICFAWHKIIYCLYVVWTLLPLFDSQLNLCKL